MNQGSRDVNGFITEQLCSPRSADQENIKSQIIEEAQERRERMHEVVDQIGALAVTYPGKRTKDRYITIEY